MNNFVVKKIALAAVFLTLSHASVANTVAVWNSQLAVANSNYAKAKVASLQAAVQPKQQQLQGYKANIERLQQQYVSQKATLTDVQKQAIRDQIQTNLDSYEQVAGQIQTLLSANETDVMQKIAPKIKPITDAIIQQKSIDILLDNRDRSITFVKPEWDITSLVTQKINEQVR